MATKQARLRRSAPAADVVGTESDNKITLDRLHAEQVENPHIGPNDLGDFQAIVLLTIANDSPDAAAPTIYESVCYYTGTVADQSQTYTTIQRLIKQDYVVVWGSRKSEAGGPPVQLLAITPKGMEALGQKHRRIEALEELFDLYYRVEREA